VTVQAMIPAIAVFVCAFRQTVGLNSLLFKWPKNQILKLTLHCLLLMGLTVYGI
jgi:hypothetical protein